MRKLKPYKVVALEPGMANVVDRKTGSKVGNVITTNVGWQGFIEGQYQPITMATIETEERLRRIFGPTRDLTNARLRSTAAAKVWAAHLEREKADG